ncbi:hypothetical protein bAD24_p01750 (plasmid) [Burkholderia sp. AD24]|jgi:hypothetical protein|nr:hypothetical protein bAD24_p01750 [Burkholderia sp. AD24]
MARSHQKSSQLPLRFEYIVKRSPCELGVIQRQQRFKVADYLRREPPLPRFMSMRQGVFDRIFGDLELLYQLVAVTSTLQIPTQVHRAHKFIDQMAVAMSVAACDQRKMVMHMIRKGQMKDGGEARTPAEQFYSLVA